MPSAQTLIALIKKQGGELNPPATDSAIKRTEKRLGFSLPNSLRDFYRTSNGASMPEMLWEFFSLRDLELHETYRQNLSSNPSCKDEGELDRNSILIFADVMIDAPSYWIAIDPKLSNYGKIYSDGDSPWWLAAESYNDFVGKITDNLGDLYIGLN